MSGTATPEDAVALLSAANVRDTLGFTLNIGGYTPDREIAATAKTIRAGLQTATGRDDLLFLVDTSRNGGITAGNCNPAGARLGPYSTLSADPSQAQNLWLTTPGVSDGPCGIAPQSHAGTFEPGLARALATPPAG